MINGLCHSGTWGSLENLGGWGWIGLILNLVFWVGLLAGLTLLVVSAIWRARVNAASVPSAIEQPNAGSRLTTGSQPTVKEILQAQYARGEITREQYELRKRELG
jgi:uncharacterized membrane protein